jgi:hypothetical protein
VTGYATSTPAEAALFNPAFMAVLVASSASDHQRVGFAIPARLPRRSAGAPRGYQGRTAGEHHWQDVDLGP